jgi:hypothetical protein
VAPDDPAGHPGEDEADQDADPEASADGDGPGPDEPFDVLPEDLDVTAAVGDYEFPDNARRRIPGIIYLVAGAASIVVWLVGRGDDAVLVNRGLLLMGVLLVLIGLGHLWTAWPLDHDEKDALVTATREVGFPVGHAAAQMGWRGFRSRPTWRILVYSTDEPPSKRGLVLVDGVDGEVLDTIVEDNPDAAGAEADEPEGG